MNLPSKVIAVELTDGTIIKVEVTPIGEQKVSFGNASFSNIANSIKSIVGEVATSLQGISEDVKPDKLGVKLGVEIASESGQLTALLV